MAKVKAIIFDMDGVIIDSEPLWGKQTTIILGRRNINYRNELKKKIIGRDARKVIKIIIDTYNLNDTVDDLLAERIEIMSELFRSELKLKDNAKELITELANNYKLAIASNSPQQLVDIALDKFSLRKYFPIVVNGNEVRKRKPDPEIYLLTAKKLNVKPVGCLAFEDSPPGIKSAKDAGMLCFGVCDRRYLKEEDLKQADRTYFLLNEVKPEHISDLK